MRLTSPSRRLFCVLGAAWLPGVALARTRQLFSLYTFGDSILDCGHYNAHGVTPAALIVENRDPLFPEFRGRDLRSQGVVGKLVHRARDGATVAQLRAQARGLSV